MEIQYGNNVSLNYVKLIQNKNEYKPHKLTDNNYQLSLSNIRCSHCLGASHCSNDCPLKRCSACHVYGRWYCICKRVPYNYNYNYNKYICTNHVKKTENWRNKTRNKSDVFDNFFSQAHWKKNKRVSKESNKNFWYFHSKPILKNSKQIFVTKNKNK